MPYIILDRDGVINHDSDHYIKSPDEWLPIPRSLAAVARLNQAGFTVLVVTNQSGVARGLYDTATLHQIHDKMHRELAQHGGEIEEIFFCPHHPDEQCLCRKPKPGLVFRIQEKYDIHLPDTYFVGDRVSDTGAALAAGCKPLLVRTGKGEKTIAKHPELATIPNFADLADAVEHVITEIKKS